MVGVFLFLLLMVGAFHCSHGKSGGAPRESFSLLAHVHNEASSLSSVQARLQTFLQAKGVCVGAPPEFVLLKQNSLSPLPSQLTSTPHIAISTAQRELDCRVALDRVPIGFKCIAPCGCSGSQKWIQFSLLNKLRRKDPEQWKYCRTCQKSFDYSVVYKYGGLKGNALSYLLDSRLALRSMIAGFLLSLSRLLRVDFALAKLMTSRMIWQFYPQFSKFIHLPFVFHLWIGKIALQYAHDWYILGEKSIVSMLADVETKLVEPRLPVTF